MKTLIFRYYDHAVMFRSLNGLSGKLKPKFINSQQTVLLDGSKIAKMNTSGLLNTEWLVK